MTASNNGPAGSPRPALSEDALRAWFKAAQANSKVAGRLKELAADYDWSSRSLAPRRPRWTKPAELILGFLSWARRSRSSASVSRSTPKATVPARPIVFSFARAIRRVAMVKELWEVRGGAGYRLFVVVVDGSREDAIEAIEHAIHGLRRERLGLFDYVVVEDSLEEPLPAGSMRVRLEKM